MRILVIHPGHAFSTSDVHDGLVYGLRQNGATVLEFPLRETLEYFSVLHHCARQGGMDELHDLHMSAAAGIPGFVMYHQIDVVLTITGTNLPYTVPLTLRRGGVLTGLICTESPYSEREKHDAAPYDLVFSNDRAALPSFTRNDPNRVHYLQHAYHPERHTADGIAGEPGDVYFCGTRFPERTELFDAVDWDGIAFLEHGVWIDRGAGEDAATAMRRMRSNAEVAAHYRATTIALNHHRSSSADGTAHLLPGVAYSLGPRAYEIAACGAFQLCDTGRPELRAVFGDAVPTYRHGDPADLETQIRYWLAHDHERHALAAQAQECVKPHSWTNRAAFVLEILEHTQKELPHGNQSGH